MNTAEIRKKIETEYEEAMSADRRITKIAENAKKTYANAATYASRAGLIIGRILARNLVSDDSEDDGISGEEAASLVTPALRMNYKNVAGVAVAAQEAMNAAAGVGLAALTPAFDEGKAAEITSAVANGTSKAELIKEGENASRKTVDESMRVNAEAHSASGLRVTVTRIYDGVGLSGGRECKFCKDREVTDVPYGEAYDKGAFQRHPGCGCELLYKTGKRVQRQNDWTRNQWEDVNSPAIIKARQQEGIEKNFDPSEMESVIGHYIQKRTAELYEEAKNGGHDYGTYLRAMEMAPKSLRSSIRSHYVAVIEHTEKIKDPEHNMTKTDPNDPVERKRAIKTWEDHRARNARQAAIEIEVWRHKNG